ncbi:hypothetical protein ABW19_dt0200388 [Dactylella cylindrospora]|nr:hypothetical protein ABW19_dt0200388 [Dactylella cylindrospora]
MRFFTFVERLALLALLLLPSVANAFIWTVTSYFQVITTTSYFSTYTDSDWGYTSTTTQTVKSGVTPTAKPLSTAKYTRTHVDMLLVYVYLPEGSVPQSNITTEDWEYVNTGYTVYIQPVTFTAPASCPTPFTVEGSITVPIPTEVTDQVTPTSVTSWISTGAYYSEGYTRVTAYLSRDAVPLPSSWIASDPTQSYYVNYCRNPTATGAAYWGPDGYYGYYGDDDDDDSDSSTRVCSLLTGCTSLRIWIIVVASVIPSLFVLGFFENYFWFTQLMKGRTALRLGTVCWVCISLWILCFTRTAEARSPEDQARLREQWNSMSAGTRWKLWWRWGFRRQYPVELLGDPKAGTAGAPPPMAPVEPGLPDPPAPAYNPQMQQEYFASQKQGVESQTALVQNKEQGH